MMNNKIYDVDIQEALAMTKPFEQETYDAVVTTAF